MDNGLVRRWNEVVAPGDEVWVLGDVALGRIDESLPLVGRLAGRKRLLTGNHDRCWPPLGPKADGWEDRYLDAGFEEVHHGSLELVVGGETVVACHFPYVGDSQDHDRYVEHRPADEGRWLVHGHVHDSWRQRGRMVNVGVDAWAGRPVAEDELATLIAAGPADRSPVPFLDRQRAKLASEPET